MRLAPLPMAASFLVAAAMGCAPVGGPPPPPSAVHADDLLVVDCLLPGRVRTMGGGLSYTTPSRPQRTSALDCRARGGAYTPHDQARREDALRVWLPAARAGDARAQTHVGEIFARGLGSDPDPATARQWYERAAAQGSARAQHDLGEMYEVGAGVGRDLGRALAWYRRAAAGDGGAADFVVFAADAGYARTEVPAADLAAPTLQIVEPPLSFTRGGEPPGVALGAGDHTVVGRVVAPAGLSMLSLAGAAVAADADGFFSATVRVGSTDVPVAVTAEDELGRRAVRGFVLRGGDAGGPASPGAAPARAGQHGIDWGSRHALVIGNARYLHLPDLETPGADARAVSSLLRERYGFEVTTLLDADRYLMLSTLERLRRRLTGADDLVVYYSGRSECQASAGRGWWLPVDAQADEPAGWISSSALADLLDAMAAGRVLLVADACHAGASAPSAIPRLGETPGQEQLGRWLERLRGRRARTLLSSGAPAPMAGGATGGEGHSVFAAALLDVLRSNAGVLEGRRLHETLAARMAWRARMDPSAPVPRYAPVRFGGHETGDFLLTPTP